MERISAALKAMGHAERLRILALLSHGELTVSELVKIVGLSQPRVTQYIKSLEDAGIIDRVKEGSWVFSRLNRKDVALFKLVSQTLKTLPMDDVVLVADRRKLDEVRAERAKTADAFFDFVANDSSQLGDEYLPRDDIDRSITDFLADMSFDFMIDMGTGSGRILKLLSGQVERGAGVDNNSEMLKVARHRLSDSNISHLTVRHGDLFSTPFAANTADLVTIHQVLHYLDDPSDALREASRLLQTGGYLLIVDFASHNYEEFRDRFAHRRLGFSDADIVEWVNENGMNLQKSHRILTEAGKPDVSLWLCHKYQDGTNG